jgi:muramidase (phage lysozyme)
MIVEALLTIAALTGPNSMPDSTYTGPWYVAGAEPFRKCVMWRESKGHYRADGPYGSGAYQFIQSTWDHYAELAGHAEYVGKRPYKAPRDVQDAVFWRTFWKGKGKHHWSAIHALTIGKTVKQCT